MTTNQKRVLEHMLLHPEKIVNYVFTRKLSRFIKDDELYLKILFKLETGKSLNLENPKTLNEKLQWLKLHYRKPEFVIMADKYAAKRYIASKIGEKHVIPLLGVWDRPEEIDFENQNKLVDTTKASFVQLPSKGIPDNPTDTKVTGMTKDEMQGSGYTFGNSIFD